MMQNMPEVSRGQAMTGWMLSTKGSPNRALGLLFIVGLLCFVDRIVLSVLQVPIQKELGLSDAQLGMLTGLAFFVPYTLMSWPLGRLSDLIKRKYVLTGVLTVWSSMTALISVAHAFAGLVIFRMGVAIGESACLPTSYSLIADFFPPKRRGKAIAIFVLTLPIGSMVGLIGAGALAHLVGWRNAFLVIGMLGLMVAPVILVALHEPTRGESDETKLDPGSPVPRISSTIRMLWAMKSFRTLALAAALQNCVVATVINWTPLFYVRVHHLTLPQAGLAFGILTGVGGACGSYAGGALGDRLAASDDRWYAWVPALSCGLIVPIALAQYLVTNSHVSLAFGLGSAMLLSLFVAPVYAVAQSLVPPQIRAFTAATLMATVAIVGSAGSYLVGVLSDFFRSHYDTHEMSLRYAICVSLAFSAMAACAFVRAAAHLRSDEPNKLTPARTAVATAPPVSTQVKP